MRADTQLLPPLSPEALRMLREDIEQRGVMVPVELDQDGDVVDGHTRVAIAEELGIKYPTIKRTFETQRHRDEHAIKLNLCRRQMSVVLWGQAFDKLCRIHGAKPGSKGGRPKSKNQDTVSQLAKECGVTVRTARRRMKAARDYETAGDKYSFSDFGEKKTVSDVRKECPEPREKSAKKQAAKKKTDAMPGLEKLKKVWWTASEKEHKAFRKWLETVED